MNRNASLYILFGILSARLSYEYDEEFIDGSPTEAGIIITRKDATRIMYVSVDVSNDDDDFVVSVYDNYNDDKPIETFYWITSDPKTTIESVISSIEERFQQG